MLHLWHSRRATVRIKAELTVSALSLQVTTADFARADKTQAAVYDKALRRKDVSGVIGGKEDEKEQEKGKDGAPAEKKSNADSGKVVNLMAGAFISTAFAPCLDLGSFTINLQATRTASAIQSLWAT